MLISPARRFLFVHVPKTAGTSLTEALAPFAAPMKLSAAGAIRRALPGRVGLDGWFEMHDSAAFASAKLGRDAWDNLTTFAVVRDPFAHALSHYRFLRGYRYARWRRLVQAMDFAAYLDWRLTGPPHWLKSRTGRFARLPDQAWFLTDGAGKLLVDRVLRFESLAEDFAALTADLGLPATTLPHRRQQQDQAGEITAAAAEKIQRLHARDFALFGYSQVPA